NTRPIPLDLERYPAPDRVTFVAYTHAAPRDPFDNALNRLATTFDAPGIGTGGGTGPALPRGSGSGAGTTAAPATAAPGTPGAIGGGGGSGCALVGPTAPRRSPAPWALLGLVIALAAVRRAAR